MNTMLIVPQMVLPGMSVVLSDGALRRVADVYGPDRSDLRYRVRVDAPGQYAAYHSHEYVRVSARIPAHVRGAVLATAGYTGEYCYAQQRDNGTIRHHFTWVPNELKGTPRGLMGHFLSYHKLKKLSDHVLHYARV